MNFIPAELTTVDGIDAVSFPGAGGRPVTRKLHQPVGTSASGRKVVLGIRPEHLSRHNPELRGKGGLATLVAPVEVVEPTGAETMAVLRLGELEVVGRFTPDEAPVMGEEMVVSVDMTHACLFDPTTQRLL
jgi:multiple sugar transport system ATP-binding protein